LYQVSMWPRAWTDEIDGSSSFTVLPEFWDCKCCRWVGESP
jgi:hypothetical protein